MNLENAKLNSKVTKLKTYADLERTDRLTGNRKGNGESAQTQEMNPNEIQCTTIPYINTTGRTTNGC